MSKLSFSIADISASGMMAERHRMEVIANNIANANSTRANGGGPYQRQQVIFAAAMQSHSADHNDVKQQFSGVRVAGVQADQSEFPLVYNPGHPDADETGMVRMPNVSLPNEMVDLITASRAYEANLKALKNFRDMTEQTLALIRGS
jgi:flagellar basal-body rod protein FlgC